MFTISGAVKIFSWSFSINTSLNEIILQIGGFNSFQTGITRTGIIGPTHKHEPSFV